MSKKALERNRELTRVHYGAMLGAGSFDKIYAIYPYVDVLLDNFDLIAESVTDCIETETEKWKDHYNKEKNYLRKNVKKRIRGR